MDESRMTEEAKRLHDQAMSEAWAEWIEEYCPGVRMVDPLWRETESEALEEIL